jgi:hypothetical protein
MENRHDRGRLILAIYPTTRGFGFVVFEGERRPIDWGVKEVRGDKNRQALAKAAELMSWHQADMVVLENAQGVGSRRSDRIKQLHRQLADLAKESNVALRQFSRSDIKAVFASRGASTKYEIAQAICKEWPDLAPWLPAPRKIWNSEDPKLSIFDAASLAIACFESKQRSRQK